MLSNKNLGSNLNPITYLPLFWANYAALLNLILFIFYFERVFALPFLWSYKEYQISESLYYKHLCKLQRIVSMFHIWLTLSPIQPKFTVLIQHSTEMFSILHSVHFITFPHTQRVIKTFVIILRGSLFNLKLKSQL